jgi:hypothetical protein
MNEKKANATLYCSEVGFLGKMLTRVSAWCAYLFPVDLTWHIPTVLLEWDLPQLWARGCRHRGWGRVQ